MKVQLLNTVIQAGTNIKFHKGRVYSADVATNQKGAMRLVKNQTDLLVKKVFVKRGEDSMLLDQNDFTIVSFPELKELLFNYKQSKIHIPRGPKLVVPKGRILRDNFRPITEKEKNKQFKCDMGLADRERCNRETNFIKVIGLRLKIARCMRCATFVSK